MAISHYISNLNPESSLVGRDPREKSEIFQWCSFADSEFESARVHLVFPLLGWTKTDSEVSIDFVS